MDESNNINLNNKTSSIHTYAGDMATMVRENEASVIKIAMAEQKRRSLEIEKQVSTQQKNRALIFGILSVVLIIGSIFIYKYLEQRGKVEATHPEIITQLPTLIPADTQTIIDASSIAGREDLVRVIKNLKNQKKNGLIESIFLKSDNKIWDSAKFLEVIGSSIPGNFQRSLDSNIMIGIYRPTLTNNQNGLFFVFRSNSYEQAVAGAYAWEKTLLDEFSTIFNIDIKNEKILLLQKPFEDILIQNTDARVLKDLDNKPIMYSVLLNQNLYIVSDKQEIIIEALKRLRTQNAKPL